MSIKNVKANYFKFKSPDFNIGNSNSSILRISLSCTLEFGKHVLMLTEENGMIPS